MDAIESLGEVNGDGCCAERSFRLIEIESNCGGQRDQGGGCRVERFEAVLCRVSWKDACEER